MGFLRAYKQTHLPDIKDFLDKISSGEIKDLKDEKITLKSFEWHDKSEKQSTDYNGNGVILRLINPFPLAHEDMLSLVQESDPVCMLTGDSSFIEGIATSKVILYQIMCHKRNFYEAMCEVLAQLPRQYKTSIDLERYKVKKLIEEQKGFQSLYAALTDPSIQDTLRGLQQKGLHYLKPLYLFMALQKVYVYHENDKIQRMRLLTRIAIDYQDVLQEGMESLKDYLLEHKNLHDTFPRYVYAQTTSPVYSPLYTLREMQKLWPAPRDQESVDSMRLGATQSLSKI